MIIIKSGSYDYNLDEEIKTKYDYYSKCPGVSVMAITNREEMIENIVENFVSQRYLCKELIIGINKTHIDLDYFENKYHSLGLIRFYNINDEVTLGGCYNYIIPLAIFPYIAHFDDDDYYAPKYLEDMTSAMLSSGADLVGKKMSYVYFQKKNILTLRNPGMEFTRVYHMDGPTLFYRKSLAMEIPFPDITLGVDTDYCTILNDHNKVIYSCDRYNHAYLRRGDGSHTWSVNEEELLSSCIYIGPVADYKEYVKN